MFYKAKKDFKMKTLYKKSFGVFLLMHFIIWTLVPFLRKSLPLDTVEAITWGRYCDWGTNKHPSLSGFPADWFYNLFGNYGPYILNQVLVLIGFIYIYKLAKCFLNENKAVMAVMLLEGVIYYGFSAQEYNVNVVSLALWPLTAYYFYIALESNKLSAWVLTGLFAGLNIFNKYVGGIELICMALYLFFTQSGRTQFKKVGPYITFLIFLGVIAPHIWWLYEHDFYSFEYLMGRADNGAASLGAKIWAHIFYPIKFLGSQILFALMTLILFALAYKKAEKEANYLSLDKKQFIFYMGIMPVLLFASVALISGSKLKSMWGFPTMYMLGIVLLSYYPFKLSDSLFKKMRKSVYVAMGLFAVAATSVILFNKSEKINFPYEKFAEDMTYAWSLHTKAPLEYAGGEIWYIANLSIYAPSHPKPVAGMKPEHSPWFDANDIMQKGALVIFPDKNAYLQVKEKYKNMSEPSEYKLEFKNRIGKLKSKVIYYGFLKPQVEVKDE